MKNRNILKSIAFILLLSLIISVIPSTSIHAASAIDAWVDEVVASIMGTGKTGGTTVKDGVDASRQGWVIYAIDKSGNIMDGITPVFIYDVSSWQDRWRTGTVMLNTRYGDVEPVKVSKSELGITIPASYKSGSGSNYEEVRARFTNNAFLNSLFNEFKNNSKVGWDTTQLEKAFNNPETEEECYIILEPVYWHGMHKKVSGGGGTSEPSKSEIAEAKRIARVRAEQDMDNAPDEDQFLEREGCGSRIAYIKKAQEIAVEKLKAQYAAQPEESGSKWEITGYFTGTVYQGGLYERANVGCFASTALYRHGYFCTYIMYSRRLTSRPKTTTKVELQVPTNTTEYTITANNVTGDKAYGIAAFSSKGDDNPPTPVPPVDEEYEPVSMYETKNYSDRFNISKAIPSSEDVINEINCAAFMGDGNFIGTKSASSGIRWQTKISYYWTEREWDYHEPWEEDHTAHYAYQIPGGAYGVVGHDPDLSGNPTWWTYKTWHNGYEYVKHSWTHSLGSETYKFSADLKYQYIKETPHVYTFESAGVVNNTYENRVLHYDSSNTNNPTTVAQMKLWNRGDGLQTIVNTNSGETTAGVQFNGNMTDHYSFAGSLTTSKSVNVATYDWGYRRSSKCYYNSGSSDKARSESSEVKSLAESLQSRTWSRNDYLAVIDDKLGNAVICSDTKIYGCDVTAYKVNGVTNSTYATYSGKDSARNNGYGNNLEKINDDVKTSRISGKQTTTIPANCDNGDWVTGMTVTYRNIFGDNSTWVGRAGQSQYGSSAESIYKHVMRDGILSDHTGTLGGGEADGYPVRVHTPIVSPIDVVDNTGTTVYEATQLISGSSLNDTVENQLLLDKNYYIKWDNALWNSNIYGDVGYGDIFDEYVAAKYLMFPFDVEYNGKLYKTGVDGYTEWIRISEPSSIYKDWNDGANVNNYESKNHWQMTPFYIPSYAGETGTPENSAWIICKVEAINAHTKYSGDHSNQLNIIPSAPDYTDISKTTNLEDDLKYFTQNSKKVNYVATCSRKIQLSGWVYDFSIVGNENMPVYTGMGFDNLDLDYMKWAMADVRQEMKVGKTNRNGNNWIRFLNDGYTQNSLAEHLWLPVRQGSSLVFAEMGALWRAVGFAYTIKTMGDYYGVNDSIEITPTYTYVRNADGSILNNDDMFIATYDSKDNIYCTATDRSSGGNFTQSFQLRNEMFKNSYYDAADTDKGHFGNWVATSTALENRLKGAIAYPATIDEQEFMWRNIESYTLDHITLPIKARYISGEYEQLAMNDGLMYTGVKRYNSSGYTNAVEQNEFIYSMQQWNGVFEIPDKLLIVDKSNTTATTFIDYLKEITKKDGGFRWNDEHFEDLDGYLIINFDIIVKRTFCNDCNHYCNDDDCYKNGHRTVGKEYLRYNGASGGGLDMWQRQSYNTNPTFPTNTPVLPIKEADVAIVDCLRSIGDYWGVGILNIN